VHRPEGPKARCSAVPAAADTNAAAREPARTATANGSRAPAAAYGVNDIAGTSGKPRSAPVARSTAHIAHGSAEAVAWRRRVPEATIAVTVARAGARALVGCVVTGAAPG
jgi:hypothetical protein